MENVFICRIMKKWGPTGIKKKLNENKSRAKKSLCFNPKMALKQDLVKTSKSMPNGICKVKNQWLDCEVPTPSSERESESEQNFNSVLIIYLVLEGMRRSLNNSPDTVCMCMSVWLALCFPLSMLTWKSIFTSYSEYSCWYIPSCIQCLCILNGCDKLAVREYLLLTYTQAKTISFHEHG